MDTLDAENNNSASGIFAAIGGGRNNLATRTCAVICGGDKNYAAGDYCTIGGGKNNLTDYIASTISGGMENVATGNYSTIGGGRQNTAHSTDCTVGGGKCNTASRPASTVCGGTENSAEGVSSTVSGGTRNAASGDYSNVSGGSDNVTIGNHSTIAGGTQNTIVGDLSAIAGGYNLKLGTRSFGFSGQEAKKQTDLSTHPGTAAFVDVDLWLYNVQGKASELRLYEPTQDCNGYAKYVAVRAQQNMKKPACLVMPANTPTPGDTLVIERIEDDNGIYTVYLKWGRQK